MIALYLSPLYILINIYIAFRTLQWLAACSDRTKTKGFQQTFIFFYILLASSIGLAFILPHSPVQRIIAHIGSYWLGILLYIALTLAIAEILGQILKFTKILPKEHLNSRRFFVRSGLVCILIMTALSLYGMYSATHVQDTFYEIEIPKDGGNLNELDIALIADLHLGYTIGEKMMTQMVEKVNQHHPDLILIAGDIFDNDYDAIKHPEKLIDILSGLKSTYGTYAVYGNHDAAEKILAGFTFPSKEKKMSDPRMDAFLEQSGIQLITEETLLIEDSFYLIGRADEERPGRNVDIRKTPQEIMKTLDASKPVIVMEHEPKFLQEIAEAGIDLHLAGHTHDGQTFPANLITNAAWENPAGYLNKDGMQSIVTSGVGLFGPNMRVGTKSEVVHIHIKFTEK